MATTDSCNLSPTWKCPMEKASAGWRWEQEDWFGGGCFMNVLLSLSLPLFPASLSLSLQPHGSLPALAWEIQMSKAAIPLHLGGVHSESSARSWTIWLRTKRIRKRSEFLCACSFRSVSGLSGCSVEDPSLTKIQFVHLWTFTQT